MVISIDNWKDRLLDVGKRNNLISFKDSKSTIEAILPGYETIFSKITGDSGTIEVFDTDCRFGNQNDNSRIPREEFLSVFPGKLKSSQVALFNEDLPTIAVLKQLYKKSKDALMERGINILYLAFGFVRWFEPEDPDTPYYAPLILVPVKITIESVTSPIKIKLYEDSISTNPSFNYKLQAEFNISLPEYEDGKLSDYFLKVSEHLEKLNWTVLKDVKLGTFSFLKMDMYLDLKNNESQILENRNVKLLTGDGEAYNTDMSIRAERNIEEIKLSNVVDADSSQIEAISLAKEGYSFVLEGPPGTGKSQTITNIISELLADGKKVLFVSEKLAALNVVYNNLRKVRLSDFCLELHSHKTNKKEVISELNRVLSLTKSSVSDKATQELETLYAAKKQLNDYSNELHREHPLVCMSLYELYGEMSGLSEFDDLDYIIPSIKKKGADYLSKVEEMLSKYSSYSKSIGHNYKEHDWHGCICLDSSYQNRIELKEHLKDTIKDIRSLIENLEVIRKAYGVNVDSLTQTKTIYEYLRLAADLNFHHASLYDGSLDETIGTFEILEMNSNIILKTKEKLSKTFEDSIFQLDCDGFYARYRKEYTGALRFLKKGYRDDQKTLKLSLKHSKGDLSYEKSVDTLKELINIKKAEEELASHAQLCSMILDRMYRAEKTDWQRIISQLYELRNLMSDGLDISPLAKCTKENVLSVAKDFVSKNELSAALLSIDEQILFFEKTFDRSILDLRGMDLEKVILDKLNRCINNYDSVDTWINFWKLHEDLRSAGLMTFIDRTIEEDLRSEHLTGIFKKLYYKQWISHICSITPILSDFDRNVHDRNVQLFIEKDRLQFKIARAKIDAKLSASRPNLDIIVSGSDVQILRNEGEKKRNQKPVRELLSAIPKLVLTLKPCFLMSPLSVSTFLGPDFQFDAVIFDEASQIYPEDAIGAIYRAKQVIVAGDPRQMPPSDFFIASLDRTDSDDDDYDQKNDMADFDSILDICLASYTKRGLKWHYRSRIEDLIAFSNKNFYKNELITFPSAYDKDKDNGIEFHYLEDGVFDRNGRKNMREAEYVAELVFQHYRQNPKRSLGVVAFSQSQQECIDSVITKKRENDQSLEEFFRDDHEEPFFVKNLETVQGDERDTIIFSVGYAKDANGKFKHNFGPLTRQGGERRLNVAVTRAKHNVKLVSSIKSSDIDSSGKSEGVRLIKEYLDYAENGVTALRKNKAINEFSESDFDFEMEVCKFLRDNGYIVDTQVGYSDHKIDLAVKDPSGCSYILAIECDGVTYASSKTVRDRDRLRQEVLEKLGWKFYRIWSTSWFKNNKLEKERLLSFIREAVQEKENGSQESLNADENTVVIDDTFIEEKVKTAIFNDYVKADDRILIQNYYKHRDLLKLVSDILTIESPLSEDWLLKRIVPIYGQDRVTKDIRDSFKRAMKKCSFATFRNGFWYSNNQSEFEFRINSNRDIKYIAVEELATGLYEVIKQNANADIAGLIKTIANLLGYSRTGDTIRMHIQEALAFLERLGAIQISGENASIS